MERSIIISTIRPALAERLVKNYLLHQLGKKDEIVIINSSNYRMNIRSKKVKVYHKKLTLPQARNFGIQKSRGKYLVFIDDDCIPHKNWLNEITKFKDYDEKVACITGRTLPIRKTEFDLYFNFDKGSKPKIFKSHFVIPSRIGSGNNMAAKRKIFRRIKFYNGPAKLGACPGEDLDFFYKVLKNGWWIAYNPLAIVKHDTRHHAKNLEKIAYYYGVGAKFLFKRNPDLWMTFLFLLMLGKLLLESYDPIRREYLKGMLFGKV